MDAPEDSSESWVERDSLRQWAVREQSLLRSIASHDREELNRTFAIADQSRLSERVTCPDDYLLRNLAQLSPQRLLYPELLRQVFIQLRYENKDEFTFPFALEHPPAIFRVCRRWRQVALGTGELFSRLDLASRPSLTTFHLHSTRWLSLSRQALLDVSFARDVPRDDITDIDLLIWSKLVQHFPRWRSLNCRIHSWTQVDEIRSIQISSDALEALFIDLQLVVLSHEQPVLRETPETPLHLPNLQIMHIQAYNTTDLSLLQDEFETPISTDLSLTLDIPDKNLNNEVVDVINSFKGKITWLEINANGLHSFHDDDEDSEDHGPSYLRLPDLQSCAICLFDAISCPCLFSGCPQLVELSLDHDDILRSPDDKCSTVLKSVTSLTLGIWYNSIRREGIYQYFLRFPALVNLAWNTVNAASRSFTEYLQALKREGCCPRLVTLSITNGSMDQDDLLDCALLRSQLRQNHDDFRITLSECPDFPDVELLDAVGLRAEIGNYVQLNSDSD